jgi:hypothetical protein
MTRKYFEGQWAVSLMAQPSWAAKATAELRELWWREFQGMRDTQFQALCAAVLDACKFFPSIAEAKRIAANLATPAAANKKAIDALLLHGRVIAEHNSSMLDSSMRWLVEMHTGQAWPLAVTDDRLEELKTMLDRVDDVAWEVLTYRSYVLSMGILEAADALRRNYGEDMADQIMARAKEAMPNVDAPPTHTTVIYRRGHEQRELEPVGKALEEPWYNRE